jgi:hypothetical protein
MQLGNKFGCEPSVAISDQSDVTPETREFPRMGDRLTTKCGSFSDKMLYGARYGECQAHILIGILLPDLIVGRFTHEPIGSRSTKLFSLVTTSTQKCAHQLRFWD